LQQAISIDPKSADTIANLVVLNTLLGNTKETAELKEQLQQTDGQHRALSDWKEKKEEFAKAAGKVRLSMYEVHVRHTLTSYLYICSTSPSSRLPLEGQTGGCRAEDRRQRGSSRCSIERSM
jgi:hypothetical protein